MQKWTFTAYAAHACLLGLLSHGKLILPGVVRTGHGSASGGPCVVPVSKGEGCVSGGGNARGDICRDETREDESEYTTGTDPWNWMGWWEARGR